MTHNPEIMGEIDPHSVEQREPDTSELKEPVEQESVDTEIPEKFKKDIKEVESHEAFIWGHLRTFKNTKKNFSDDPDFLTAYQLLTRMNEGGEEFKQAFEKYLLQNVSKGHKVYKYLCAYEALESKNKEDFLISMLDKGAIWNDPDSSSAKRILQQLHTCGGEKTVVALINYLNHIYSNDYVRKQLQTYDASFVEGELAYYKHKKKLTVDVDFEKAFDKAIEQAPDISSLVHLTESKYKEYVKNVIPPEEEPDDFLLDLEDSLFDNDYPNDFGPAFQPSGKLELSPGFAFKIQGHMPDAKDTNPKATGSAAVEKKFTEHELDASQWEWDKRIHWYGRFRGEREDVVEINNDNAITSLIAVTTKKGVSERDYLTFLEGRIKPQDLESVQKKKLGAKDLYALASLAYARALTMAECDHRYAQAGDFSKLASSFLRKKISSVPKPEQPVIEFLINKLSAFQSEKLPQVEERKTPEIPKLGSSADPFFIYHSSLQKLREVPSFSELLSERVRWYMANDLKQNIDNISIDIAPLTKTRLLGVSGPSLARLSEISKIMEQGRELYRRVETEDVPLYWEANDVAEQMSYDKNVIYGRDGKYFFTALKAHDFGVGNKDLKYIIVTRNMRDAESRGKILQYLQENGVTLDYTHIDTGYSGSLPKFCIDLLAEAEKTDLTSEEVDRRIKLLSSTRQNRDELSRKSGTDSSRDVVGKIEDRPQPIQSPYKLEIDETSGKLKPKEVPSAISEQIKAWVVEHAVFRNFVPRLEEEKRVEYLREDPLKGYEYVQQYYGSHIGTHPLEVWRNKETQEEVLLKGGPEHTLQADYISNQFMSSFAEAMVPKAEMIFTRDGVKLKMEMLKDWKQGGINLPEGFEKSRHILNGFFSDMILGQHDRTPWNMLYKSEGKFAVFIDNGASLYSRASGGYKGFNANFDINELKFLLENPQFPGKPVNEAYTNFVHVEGDQVVISNIVLMEYLIQNMHLHYLKTTLTGIIRSAGVVDGRKSVERCKARIESLKKKNEAYPEGSRERKLNDEAIATFHDIIAKGGEATYLREIINQRVENVLSFFENAIWRQKKLEREKTTVISNEETPAA